MFRTPFKKVVFIVAISLLFVTVTTLTYIIVSRPQSSISLAHGLTSIDVPQSPLPPTDPQTLKTEVFNILTLGYGGPGHSGGSLTDIITIVHFDPQNQILGLISIPRDLWLTLPGGTNKINAAFTKSPGLAKQAFEKITGLPIHYYVGIDFVGIQRAIHQIGGIDVEVTETLDDPWYPIPGKEVDLCGHTPAAVTAMTATMSGFTLEKQFPCRYEHLHFAPGPTFMEGADVLKYVRSRHSTSDFSRGARAQTVLVGVKNRLMSTNTLNHAATFFQEIVTHLNTDLNTNIIHATAPLLNYLNGVHVIHINLSTDNVLKSSQSSSGASILLPKAGLDQFESIHQYILKELTPQ